MTRKGDAVQLLELDILALGLPAPEREHKFHPTRRWRFDFAWPDKGVAVEVDGGTWGAKSRHTTGAGYEKDCEKLNAAALGGWLVLRYTTTMIQAGAVNAIAEALQLPHHGCHPEFHRCDGGGPGEALRYEDTRGVEPGRDESHGMEMQ